MHRKFFFAAVCCLALAGVARAALPQPQPVYTVSTEQMQREVAQRFPLRYPVPGLLDLELQAPHLRLLPQQNRLSAEMAVEAAGPALLRSHKGTFDVDFALRYEAIDRTVRAYQLRLQHLRFADLQPSASELLSVYGPALAEQSLQEVVLYQFAPKDLALTDALGLQPGSITVTDDGLLIGFVAKQP
jgi:hypothetical protein